MKLFLLIAFFATITYSYGATDSEEIEFKLPENAITCDQDDPALNECIQNSIQSMLPNLANGLESLNIPPLDPFFIEKNRFDYDTGAIQGSLIVKNVKIYGITRGSIKNVRTIINEKGLKTEIEMYFPRIFVEGNYKADVKVNDVKMNPKGYLNATMTDINVVNKMVGAFETRKGTKYLRMTSFDMEPEFGNVKIFMSGLFPDPALNAIALDFLNQYWSPISRLILPATRTRWEPVMLESMNQFLLSVPFESMLTKKRD